MHWRNNAKEYNIESTSFVVTIMDLKIDFGPWKTVYEGKFSGHAVEIISNPESFFLVFIYEISEQGEKLGALVEGYKAYLAKGQMENFIETLPKPSLGITKNIGNKTAKLFFISFDPMYLDFKHEDFLRRIDNMLKKNIESNATLMDLARASSLELKELNMSPASEYGILLGDPFTMRALIGGAKESTKSTQRESTPSKSVSIQLGLSKSREIITENLENLKRTIIILNTKKEHEYAQYIIAENFLLENRPMIIFDDEDYFSDLKNASHNEAKLKDSLVAYDPIGFPMKKAKAKEEVKVAVKDVDFGLAMEILGTGDKDFNTKLILAKAPLQANKAEELALALQQSDQLNGYEKLKAERICMILAQQFPAMFGESANVNEMTKDWSGNLGRATVIDIKDLAEHEKILFVRTMLRLFSRKLESTSEIKFSMVIPNSDKIFSILPEKVETIISDLENKGVGFVLGATKKGFNKGVEKSAGTNITVVSGNDVAISIVNGKNYRALLRPSLSGNPTIA